MPRHPHHWQHSAPDWAWPLFEMVAETNERLECIMAALDDLTAQVAANRTAIDSAVVLINGIADRITAAGVDPAKLAALTADLKSSDDALAAAVVANTPAANS